MRDEEEVEVARPGKKGLSGLGLGEVTGLDAAALEDLQRAFGDGNDYWFALEREEQEGLEEQEEEKRIDLKDVFEPSQLAEKMLTDEDNTIRFKDEPERFQIARKPYEHVVLTDEQFREEAVWVSASMMMRRRIDPSQQEPFQKAVAKVLEFMTIDSYEVPFIFQHRRDYLIHTEKVQVSPDPRNPDQPEFKVKAEKLLNMVDLWDIFDLDLKYRAMIDKRNNLIKTYEAVKQTADVQDPVLDSLLAEAGSMDELQDLQDYLYFQYSSQIKDASEMEAEANGEANGGPRRKAAGKHMFERIRNSNAYKIVKAFGITADAFARNAARDGKRQYIDDPSEQPDELADSVLDTEFTNSASALKSAKAMLAEEITNNPRMRKIFRLQYYKNGVFEVYRTEKGLRKIDEHHPYYEFKYLRNQHASTLAQKPEMYLRMMKAEEEGLVEVKVRFKNLNEYKKDLYKEIESDNVSESADAWNRERREVLDLAVAKLEKIMIRSVKENMKNESENSVARICRDAFTAKLDQAPYKPKGMVLGTAPRVLALSNGNGQIGRDPIMWVWAEDDGRILENGKFMDLTLADRERMLPEGKDVRAFVELVERRQPDVIAVSGFSPDSRKLHLLLQDIVKEKDLRGAEYEDNDEELIAEPLEVVIVNDEVARLYQSSERAKLEHPAFSSLSKYCVSLAKYLQSPLKEYASLGKDIVSITFHPGQNLVPEEKLLKQLESALVDMVNLVGVEINEAVSDSYTANLLPYICGLGPRKATQLVKTINMNGGVVNNRTELLGGMDDRLPVMGVNVWNNAISFLYITYESSDDSFDYLDNTRVHPEDYDIGRKMAADALELDEEDIKAEVDEYGQGAIVRKLRKDEATDRVNDLILEEYAEQLEKNLNQRKRATLETIRAELQEPYEELRQKFSYMTSDAVFTQFTGETNETLAQGMVVSMMVRRVTDDHIDGKLDCGIDALAPEMELSDRYDIPVKSIFAPHQTVQAKILNISRKSFAVQVSLRESEISRPYRRQLDHMRDEWDERQEHQDRDLLQEKTDDGVRAVRVVKHPAFHPFNSAQAEEYLGPRNRGDVIIRPSSRGNDHLCITWKVADGVFQHIDVLELDKENDFSVGRTLKVGGRYTYSDLDELIALHVQAMARKVDEMMGHEKFQNGSRSETGEYLSTTLASRQRQKS